MKYFLSCSMRCLRKLLPFADESKINSMLSETDRNREMCNQIVRRVFTDPVQANADLLRPVGRLVSSTIG